MQMSKTARIWPHFVRGLTVPVAFSEARFQVKKVLVFGAMEDIRNDKYLARS